MLNCIDGVRILKVVFFIIILLMASNVYAAQSTITEAEGYACMGYDKSRKLTETEAFTNAKRTAVEYASTYLKSQTTVKDFQLEKDIIDAYANAKVKIIQEMEKKWYQDEKSGDCFKIKIKAEVIPDETAVRDMASDKSPADNPALPLYVSLWTDKKEYKLGEKIKIYIKGNKPFFARVLHRSVKGNMLQLLPNPYRTENYFNGGVIYEIPAGNDQFELEVSPPLGEEQIILYASTSPLGDLSLQEEGALYLVKTSSRDIGTKTRGVKLKVKSDLDKPSASEFFEEKAKLKTGQ